MMNPQDFMVKKTERDQEYKARLFDQAVAAITDNLNKGISCFQYAGGYLPDSVVKALKRHCSNHGWKFKYEDITVGYYHKDDWYRKVEYWMRLKPINRANKITCPSIWQRMAMVISDWLHEPIVEPPASLPIDILP